MARLVDTMWDESDAGDGPRGTDAKRRGPTVDLDTLADGRCTATTWGPSTRPPTKPVYENFFGPGGYNRCIGGTDHANPLHKDEWGHVFTVDEHGSRHVVRKETPRA